MTLAMSDEDSVKRFAKAVGCGKVHMPRRLPNRKQIWKWAVYNFEHTQATIALLWFGLGHRRKQQCRNALAKYLREAKKNRAPYGRRYNRPLMGIAREEGLLSEQ
jgi:hypothetical protein